jgi:Spy/CpxP family protein refolding chaperone
MRIVTGAAIATLCVSAALLAGPSHAQKPSELELTKQEVQSRRTEIVTDFLDLTPQEGDKFWPLYKQYRADMDRLNNEMVTRVMNASQETTPMSNREARSLLDDYLKHQKAKTELQQKYVNKFADILPPRKLVRYFQLENKMDAVVNLGLAGSVPLIQEQAPAPGK